MSPVQPMEVDVDIQYLIVNNKAFNQSLDGLHIIYWYSLCHKLICYGIQIQLGTGSNDNY